MSAYETVTFLNDLLIAFDEAAERYGVEKVKTIGSGYRDFDKKLGAKRGESLIYQLFNLKIAKFLIYLGFRRFKLDEVKSPSGEAFTPFW
ncbi:MAG: adenylate/guanylate cyclase domain-containing protein [Xenococcaceae cyanobacterium]